MPDWITNEIKIKTKKPEEIIDRLFTDDSFDFEKIIPSPKRIEDCPRDCIANKDSHIQLEEDRPWFNWYEWNRKNWGTKWSACDTSYEITPTQIIITFDTAWSYPWPIIKKLVEEFGSKIKVRCFQEWGEKILEIK